MLPYIKCDDWSVIEFPQYDQGQYYDRVLNKYWENIYGLEDWKKYETH